MADQKETVEEMRNAAELEPILDGVEKMAKHQVASEKRLDAEMEAVGKKVDRSVTDLDDKMEKGFGDVMERIDRLGKTRSNLNNLTEDVTNPAITCMSAQAKSMIPQVMRRFTNGDEKRAIIQVAGSEWTRLLFKGSMQKYMPDHHTIRAERDKLGAALMDAAVQDGLVHRAALQEGTTTEGGHLVPTIVASEILRQITDSAKIFPFAEQVAMTKLVHQIPDETTSVTINWVAEEGALDGGEPVFGQKTLTANKLAGRAVVSQELVEDSNIGILAWLQARFTEKMGGELDFQCMEGTGSPFTGVVGASGVNALATTASTTGAAVTYADLTATLVAAGEGASVEDGTWIMSPAVWGKVLGMVDSNGQPIVKLMSVEDSPKNTILGRPVIVSNRLSSYTVGSDATGNIYYGPLKALTFGSRAGMSWEVTDQVHWANYQMDARLVARFGYVVGVPAAWTKLTKIHND